MLRTFAYLDNVLAAGDGKDESAGGPAGVGRHCLVFNFTNSY
jgi:hypothetical protein